MVNNEPEYKDFSSWQELKTIVDAHEGVLRVKMWDLRKLTGMTRLKVHVVAGISDALADVGLAHLPVKLPRDQEDYAVIYKVASPAAGIINAVRNGSSSESAERALRSVNTSDTLRVDRKNKAKLTELSDKVEELEALLTEFHEVLDS